jgi:ankyrin repeat protein
MPSDFENKGGENQVTEGIQSMEDISSCHHLVNDESESDTRLHWFDAAISENTNEIRRLRQLGSNVGWENTEKMTALHLAAQSGLQEVVSMLVELGAAVDAPNRNAATALHYAAENGYEEVVGLLIDRGAAVDARNYESWPHFTWLHSMATKK